MNYLTMYFFFSLFILAVSFGSQRSVAGRTCKEILSEEESAVDGFYWLNSNGTEDPYVTFCNMTNGGGMNTDTVESLVLEPPRINEKLY